MAFWKTTLPVNPERRQWIDSSMWRLVRLFGRERIVRAPVVLPNGDFFSDSYDSSETAVRRVLERVCLYLGVDPDRIEFEIFSDASDSLADSAPAWGVERGSGPTGLYSGGWCQSIEVRASLLSDPVALIATFAHELCHVLLLGGGLMDPSEPDMEPFTDLATVFHGFGVCHANACVRFRQWDSGARHGWQGSQLGYLTEEDYGYALAVFAQMRGDSNPLWAAHLSTNVRSYFKRSARVLSKRS